MAHELPPLPYDYAALEPVIDTATMKLHHDMHHAAYVKNLNAALEKHPDLGSKSAEDLIRTRIPYRKTFALLSVTTAVAMSTIQHVLEDHEAERWRRAPRRRASAIKRPLAASRISRQVQ